MPQQRAKNHNLAAVPKRESTGIVPDDGSCQLCFGSGMEVIPGKGARKCICQKRDTHNDKLSLVQLPRRYETCQFNTYKPANSSQRIAAKLASDFALEFPAVDRGLLFVGDVGVGKTHLAVSILKGLTERGFKCLFYEFGALLKQIQDSYNPKTFTSELKVLAPVFSSDVLVLDELGASKPTDWVQDTLAHIINTRYNDKKFTIFTTNYADEQNDPRKETLEDRIGVRTRSRLFEMCQTIVVRGEDFRRNFDRNGISN